MSTATIINNAVLIPGNGCGRDLSDCMWYPWITEKLTSHDVVAIGGVTESSAADDKKDNSNSDDDDEKKNNKKKISMTLKGFPNHLEAFEHVWKPFAVDKLGLNGESLLVGHSSGAACSLRLMEDMPIAACVLVAAYNSDLGDSLERASGYFSRPFDYDKMVANCPFIIQFQSRDDHLVPAPVAREVSEGLRKASEAFNAKQTDGRRSFYLYVETAMDGHFQDDEYEDVMWPILQKHLGF